MKREGGQGRVPGQVCGGVEQGLTPRRGGTDVRLLLLVRLQHEGAVAEQQAEEVSRRRGGETGRVARVTGVREKPGDGETDPCSLMPACGLGRIVGLAPR
nr:unnamed protein product [Digitaria exilis]